MMERTVKPGKIRDQYDWVTIGDHPSALLSACLAAKLGLSTLVLPLKPGYGFKLFSGETVFDPDQNFFPELNEGLHRDCLKNLGVSNEEFQSFVLPDRFPELATPFGRLSFSSDSKDWVSEFSRSIMNTQSSTLAEVKAFISDWSEKRQTIQSFWSEIPKQLTIQIETEATKKSKSKPKQKKMNTLFKKRSLQFSPRSTVLQEICRGFWNFNTACDFDSIQPLHSEMQTNLSFGLRAASFKGGVSAYREFLLRLAGRLGAHVLNDLECKRIFINAGRLTGVQASQKGSMISVSGAALGCSTQSIKGLLTVSGQNWFKRLKTPLKPMGWRFTLSIRVPKTAIPDFFKHRILWSEPGAPILEIELAKLEDYFHKASSSVMIFLRTVVPYHPESLTSHYQEKIGRRMLAQLEELIPFVSEEIESEILPWAKDLYSFSKLEDIPDSLKVYGSRGHSVHSGIEGLFCVSQEAYPELGELGGTLAALEAVAWQAHRAGLPGPLG